MKKPQQMTKIEKAALDIACAYIGSDDRNHLMQAGDVGGVNRMSFAEACRDLARRLMDPPLSDELETILIDDPRHVPDYPGGDLIIWTDGSCSPNPGPGGWGLYAEADGKPWLSLNGPGGKDTTNNRMELKAAIEALKIIPPKTRAIIYTDSQYVKRGITEWISGWIRRGWKTANKKPVKNKDLWIELADLATNPNIEWKWVKAHNGNPGNEKADELAGKGRAMNDMFP